MAQEAEAARGESMIARAGKRKLGYDAAQVDAFLEHAHALYDSDAATLTQRDIQNVSFDVAKGGYDIAQVDAALSRLERAVVDRQTAAQIADQGRVAWKAQSEELYRQIAAHAARAARERFRGGEKGHPSYDRKQVDRLIDDVVDKAAAELGVDGAGQQTARGLENVTAASVAGAVFTQRKGRRGYDERQVDYYLNACVQLLTRIESFARVSARVQGTADAEPAASQAPAAATQPGVAPLFPAAPQPAPATDQPASYTADPSSAESFDALHKAEQAIFAPQATAPTPETVVAPAFPPASAAESAPVPSPAPVSVAPAVNPTVPEAPAPAPEPAAAQPIIPVSESTSLGDSSLAELAHMAKAAHEEAVQEASTAFQPHVPDLAAPSVPSLTEPVLAVPAPTAVSATTPAPVAAPQSPAAPAPVQPVHEEPATPSAGETTQAMAPVMPESFAPASKPERPSTPHVRVSEFTVPNPAPTPSPVEAVNDTPSAVGAVPSFAPSEPVAAAPVEPAAPVPPVAAAPAQPSPVTDETAANGKTNTPNLTAFPSVFPSIDSDINTDIPDLSFPSLFDDHDVKKREQ
ncbi:DivIVA domain containing protein [Bifidobacterium ramosum]|uniref:DivIVA domain-containing protein n=1 Tax=Bifidobacterium ramosum TaxID=1798158 RepID=A0A6L4X256_9BIFI|nr:DivIVA domain-containing protein [Bifidobacterium ramosum]KAB8288950.1 DivIVA domain containing protein [Bifidobacterium ramosum]NEG70667.1 DivIVA domain-containing protein [Bifidobacterium ramosum]